MSLLRSGKPATPKFSFFAASCDFPVVEFYFVARQLGCSESSFDFARRRHSSNRQQVPAKRRAAPATGDRLSCAVKVFLPSRTSSSLLRSPLPATWRSRPAPRLRVTTLCPTLFILWPAPLPATSAASPRRSAAIRLTVPPRVRIPRHFPSGIRFARPARQW